MWHWRVIGSQQGGVVDPFTTSMGKWGWQNAPVPATFEWAHSNYEGLRPLGVSYTLQLVRCA